MAEVKLEQDVLDNQLLFEKYRFYDRNSNLNKFTGAKIQEIINRLLKPYINAKPKGFDPNSFYYVLSDDNSLNAFFLPRPDITPDTEIDYKKIGLTHNPNITDKHIICVNRGFIEKCENEDMLAALLAHEISHYIWGEIKPFGVKEDHSNLSQETFSDMNGMRLMLDAGYNPHAMTDMFDLFIETGTNPDYISVSHGSIRQRRKNSLDFCSSLVEQGKDIPDFNKGFDEWQKTFNEMYKQEGYDTYIDKIIKDKFGTKDLSKINHTEVLTFFKDLLDEDCFEKWKYSVRWKDYLNILENYVKSHINTQARSIEEQKLCEDLFEKLLYFKSSSLLRTLCPNPFGKYLQAKEYLDEFLKPETIYNKDKAIEYATKLSKSNNAEVLYKVWSYHKNVEISAEYMVGKRFPERQLESYKNEEISGFLQSFSKKLFVFPDIKGHEPGTNYRGVYYGNEFYYLDEDGIVLAFGQRAKIMCEKYKWKIEEKAIKNIIEDDKKVFKNLIAAINVYMDYEQGKKSFDDSESKDLLYYIYDYTLPVFWDRRDKDEEMSFHYGLRDIHLENHPNIDYGFYFDMYEQLKNLDFYKKYVVTHPEFSKLPKFEKFETNEKTIMEIIDDDVRIIEFGGLNNGTNIIDLINYERKIVSGDVWWNRLIENCRIKLFDDCFNNDVYPDGIIDDITERRIDGVLKIKYFECPYVTYSEKMCEYVNDDEYLKYRMKSIGLARMPKNKKEIDAVMEYLLSCNKSDAYKIYIWLRDQNSGLFKNIDKKTFKKYVIHQGSQEEQLKSIVRYKYSVFLYCLKNGIKYDVLDFIKKYLTPDGTRVNDRACECGAFKELDNLVAKFVTPDYFKKLNIKDKFLVYEFMLTRDLFSKDYANQNDFIKILVNQITKNKISVDEAKRETIPDNIRYVDYLLSRRCLTDYGKGTKYEVQDRDDFAFAHEREILCEYYADYWAKKLGQDDNTEEYYQRCLDCVDYFGGEGGKYAGTILTANSLTRFQKEGKRRWFSQNVGNILLSKISHKIVAQQKVAKLFAKYGKFKIDEGQESDVISAFGLMGQVLNCWSNECLKYMKFLTNKLDEDSLDSKEYIQKIFGYNMTKSHLIIIHENFWSAPMIVRMYVFQNLLSKYSKNSSEKIKTVLDLLMNSDNKYYKDLELIVNSVYNNVATKDANLADYYLCGLLCSSPKDETKQLDNKQIGESLKSMFMAKGNAFVKFGQLLSYMPSLPIEIRTELATLRDKAQIPSRDEVFDMLQQYLPAEQFDKISYVGEILGAGSIYVSVKVKYDGKDCVVGLMRENLGNKMKFNIDLINDSVNDMAKADVKYKQLKKIVEQAKFSCIDEVNINVDKAKYEDACKSYENFTIKMGGKTYRPHVSRWINFGSDKERYDKTQPEWLFTDNAYKIMEMAPGKPLTAMPSDTPDAIAQKHDCAKAYVALELCMLLSGKSWDTDRHSGQQNFYTDENGDVIIGIYDTGARVNAPNSKDKTSFVKWIYDAAKYKMYNPDSKVADVLTDTIKNVSEEDNYVTYDDYHPHLKPKTIVDNNRLDTKYVDSVYRGLIALSDVVEYQKPYIDENGIKHKGESFTDDDWTDIFTAVAEFIDKEFQDMAKQEILADVVNILRPNWLNDMKLAYKKLVKQDGAGFSLSMVLKLINQFKSGLDDIIKNMSCSIDIEYNSDIKDVVENVHTHEATEDDLKRRQSLANKGKVFGFDPDRLAKPKKRENISAKTEDKSQSYTSRIPVNIRAYSVKNQKETFCKAILNIRDKLEMATVKLKEKIAKEQNTQSNSGISGAYENS